ncbi:MAG TPA: VWA domain-containing protein [Acidobacteriaceae bacterium]|nr:VWA domain-containing protein [Acidobacteriaceae bacterium]
MRRCSILTALLLTAAPAVLGTATAAAQAAPESMRKAPPIHVNVRLVNVYVNVTNAHGAPVSELKKSDFALSEDGQPQKIAYFEQQTNVPLSIVLAIDTSGSTRKDLPLEKAMARDFVRSLLLPTDRLDLMDFNSSVREVVPFTADIRWIDEGLDHLDIGPATALYNAIYLASQSLAQRQGRKVLVVISDGGNNVDNSMDYPQALEAARRAQVMVYSIIDLPILADAGRDEDGEHAMITMSQETGGEYFYANAGDLREAFARVSEALRTQYLLGYYPSSRVDGTESGDSQFRTISVKLTHPAKVNGPYHITNRTGYYPDSTQ